MFFRIVPFHVWLAVELIRFLGGFVKEKSFLVKIVVIRAVLCADWLGLVVFSGNYSL